MIGTVAATPLQFSVAISPDQYLQLDDVVVTSRQLPGQGPVQISGVVTNVEAVHEGARFPVGCVPDPAGRAAGRDRRGRAGYGHQGRARG